MLISYNSELLQLVCFNSSAAEKHFGDKVATSLQARHSDIQAANNVFELPVGQATVRKNLCILRISEILTIVLAPNYADTGDNDLYDWSTVGRVKFMRINDVE